MDPNPPTHTTTSLKIPPTLTQPEQLITVHIINIVQNTNPKHFEQQLQSLYDSNPEYFIKCLCTIVNKYYEQEGGGRGGQLVQAVLLYFRHFVTKQEYRMPDIMVMLVELYAVVRGAGDRKLVVDVMRVFLNKPTHRAYTRDYLQGIAFGLMQNLQMETVSQSHLRMVTETLQSLLESKQYRPGLSLQSQRIIMSIVNQYSLKKPPTINPQLWTHFILTLSSFSRHILGTDFLLQTLKSPLPPNLHVKACQAFIPIAPKLSHLETLYYLLQLQFDRVRDRQFLSMVWDCAGVEGVEVELRTVLVLVRSVLCCVREERASGDLEVQMLRGYFWGMEFFGKCMDACMVVLGDYGQESTQLSFYVTQMLEQLSQFLPQAQLTSYIHQLKQSLKQQYIFILLTGLPRPILQSFSSTETLTTHTNNLLTTSLNIHTDSHQLHLVRLFLDFVVHYVDVYRYVERDVLELLDRLVQGYAGGMEDFGNGTGLLVRAYGIGIGCRLEKYRGVGEMGVYDRVEGIFTAAYQLIEKIALLQENQQEIIGIVMDGLCQLKNLPVYRKVVYEKLLFFFNHHVLCNQMKGLSIEMQKNQAQREYLYTHFLKLVQEFHQSLQLNAATFSIDFDLFPVLKYCLDTKNKALQDQTCEFILKLLFSTNSAFHKQKINESQFNSIYEGVYNTAVYSYVEQCFMKEDQDLLYCKILMETLANQHGRKIVSKLLSNVCQSYTESAKSAVHDFDKVWEALVILQGVRNQYTEKRQINSRIDQIMGGSIEALMMNMSIDEKDIFKKQTKDTNKKINWSWLPQVRKVIEPGSVVGYIVEQKLNENS